MPHFNEFRMNEELLGKVLVAKKNKDFSSTEEEELEVRKFINELEEKKNAEKSTFYLRLIGFITGKKYIQFKDRFGQKIVREFTAGNGLKPELRLSLTIKRQIDFGDDVNAWRTYVHEENIVAEELRIEKQKNANNRASLVGAYSETINKVMMRIN